MVTRKQHCKLNRLVFIAYFLTACGLREAKYVNYQESEDKNGPLSECEQEALDNFSVNIQPVIENTCTANGCHSVNPPTTLYKKGSASENAKELYRYSRGDAQKLYNKYNSPTHGGSALGDKLPFEILNAWMTLRNSCK